MNEVFGVVRRSIDARIDDISRGGDHFEAFVELLYLKAGIVTRDVDQLTAEWKAAGNPFPDSSHPFWEFPIVDWDTPEEEQEWRGKWNAEMEKWKAGVADLTARGLTPRLD